VNGVTGWTKRTRRGAAARKRGTSSPTVLVVISTTSPPAALLATLVDGVGQPAFYRLWRGGSALDWIRKASVCSCGQKPDQWRIPPERY